MRSWLALLLAGLPLTLGQECVAPATLTPGCKPPFGDDNDGSPSGFAVEQAKEDCGATFTVGQTCTMTCDTGYSPSGTHVYGCDSLNKLVMPSNGPLVCTIMPAPHGQVLQVVVVILLGLAFVTSALWAMICKRGPIKQGKSIEKGRGSVSLHRSRSISTRNMNNLGADFGVMESEDDPDIKQYGYYESAIGSLFYKLLLLAVIAVNILIWLVAFDDYFSDVLWSNHYQRQPVYIVWWHVSLLCLLTLRVYSDKVRNFFRVSCSMADATHVLIWTRSETVNEAYSTGLVKDLLMGIRRMSAYFAPKERGTTVTRVVHHREDGAIYFKHNLQLYVYEASKGRFLVFKFSVGVSIKHYAEQKGLTTPEADLRAQKVGPNSIEIPIPPLLADIATEFWSFFYIYQYFILSVFFSSYYQIVGSMYVGIVLLSGGTQIYLKRQSQFQVAALAANTSSVVSLRDEEWIRIPTQDLVPGDLVAVLSGAVPCDLVLVQGNAVVDESMLTGESMPVAKVAVDPVDEDTYDPHHGKKHTLFCGTQVLGDPTEKKAEGDKVGDKLSSPPEVIGCVDMTGINTSKGDLVAGILNPPLVRFKFDEHMTVVMNFLMFYAVVVFFCTMIQMDLLWTADGWYYGLYRVVTVVPVLLPTVFVVAASRGANQLKAVGVFCTNPSRIMMSGKVRVWCFDKTGTLTRPGLDFVGGQPVGPVGASPAEQEFQPCSNEQKGWTPLMQQALCTTHSVTQAHGRLVGNSVDVKMFTGTEWKLGPGAFGLPDVTGLPASAQAEDSWVSSADGKKKFCILKRFQFDHSRMTMSCLVYDPETKTQRVFVKGAYEKISTLCTVLPKEYDNVSQGLARTGHYVLTVGSRAVAEGEDANLAERDSLETGLEVVGLIVFRNQPKEDTKDAMTEIRRGDVRPVMITGDNELTGVHVAKETGMIPKDTPDSRILTARLEGKKAGLKDIVWYDNEGKCLGNLDLDTLGASGPQDEGYELAVTGAAFRMFHLHDVFTSRLLNSMRVFARMKPQDKVDCVYHHMNYTITGMCGDGGNDCGALRAAHAGVALSDAEASIVSPFSSTNPSIFSVVDVLRFGRGTLASSFATYKCMILWGQICTTIALFKNHFFVSMLELNWVVVDALLCISMSFALTLAMPADRLSSRRPTVSLLGASTLASCVGLIAINFFFAVGMFELLASQCWYTKFEHDGIPAYAWWLLSENWESSTIFLLMLVQISNTAVVFNFGDVFRKPWIANWFLVVVWICFNALALVLLTAGDNDFSCAFNFNCGDVLFPDDFRVSLIIVCLANVVTVFLWERFVVLGPVADYFRKRAPRSSYIRM